MSSENSILAGEQGNVDWSVFLQEGVIVTLTIKRYRGTTSVDFSELGIDDSSDTKLKAFLGEYIQPGVKRLIPPEIEGQLKSIETTARSNLKEKSFDCSAIASNGKFVPKSMYADFKKTNEELEDRFYAIRDEFADNYDNIVNQVRKDYKVFAEKLYLQRHPEATKAPAKYVNSFVDKIIQQIPSSDEIVASFEYSTVLRRIPDYLLKVISNKGNVDENIIRIAAASTPSGSTTPTKTKKQTTKKKPAIITEEVPIPEPELLMDEIENDIRTSISSQSAGMAEDFVTEIMMRLRSDAANGASTIIQSIDKNNGKLVGRASIKAHSLVDELSKMNFYGDEELTKRITALDEALGNDKTDRDIAAVKTAATELYQWATSSMDEIHANTIDRKSTSATQKKRKKATISVPTNTKRRTIKQRS